MEGVRAAMKKRHLEEDEWLNIKEWCLGSGRRRQLSQDRRDRQIDKRNFKLHVILTKFNKHKNNTIKGLSAVSNKTLYGVRSQYDLILQMI